MKKTTCSALQGACDAAIMGETPEEMGENCKKHVMEMVQTGDEAHKAAIEKWMKVPQEEQQKWHQEFTNTFATLPEA